MATVTRSRKIQKHRTMQYFAHVGLLFISEGKKTTGYTMVETTAYHNTDEHVRSFHLTKADGETYDVLLDGPGSLCECKGFAHYGMQTKDGKGCRHVAALTKLQQLGKL